jgi:hypothetical protein
VCLPTRLDAAHVVRGLEASKHVLCGLPLADNLADAFAIAGLCAMNLLTSAIGSVVGLSDDLGTGVILLAGLLAQLIAIAIAPTVGSAE